MLSDVLIVSTPHDREGDDQEAWHMADMPSSDCIVPSQGWHNAVSVFRASQSVYVRSFAFEL